MLGAIDLVVQETLVCESGIGLQRQWHTAGRPHACGDQVLRTGRHINILKQLLSPHIVGLITAWMLFVNSAVAQSNDPPQINAGLLGKRYFGYEIQIGQTPAWLHEFYSFNTNAIYSLNLPIGNEGQLIPFMRQDLYFQVSDFNPFGLESHVISFVGSSSHLQYHPRSGNGGRTTQAATANVNAEADPIIIQSRLASESRFEAYEFQAGATFYATPTDKFRPFLRLGAGAGYRHSQFVSSQYSQRLIVKPGIEYDISKTLTIQAMLDVPTEVSANDVRGSAQAIYSPSNRWFVATGISGKFDDIPPLAVLNVGLKF